MRRVIVVVAALSVAAALAVRERRQGAVWHTLAEQPA